VDGDPCSKFVQKGQQVQNSLTGPTTAPSDSTNCCPEGTAASLTEFRLENKNKANNFIWGELLIGGMLSFIVENQPADGMVCSGQWLFDQMLTHFGSNVNAILRSWTYGVNLAKVNNLAAGGIVSVEDAAKQTWTRLRAAHWLFTQVEVISTTGKPGHYINIQVRFRK